MLRDSQALALTAAAALSIIFLLRRVRALEAQLARRSAATSATKRRAAHRTASNEVRLPEEPMVARNGGGQYTAATAPQPAGTTEPEGSEANLFETLPPETIERIFETLPPVTQLQCERVCFAWRQSVMPTLWPEWRQRQGRLSETTLSLPGVPVSSFTASPVDIQPAEAALTAEAHEAAAALPADRLQLGVSGTTWTVLAPTPHAVRTAPAPPPTRAAPAVPRRPAPPRPAPPPPACAASRRCSRSSRGAACL